MIQISTFIGILACFFITTLLSEKYYQKHPVQTRLLKMILYIMLYMFILLTVVVLFPQCFIILAYGSVIMASYFNIYNRHRKIPGEVEA